MKGAPMPLIRIKISGIGVNQRSISQVDEK
jgi:hypothetical protein